MIFNRLLISNVSIQGVLFKARIFLLFVLKNNSYSGIKNYFEGFELLTACYCCYACYFIIVLLGINIQIFIQKQLLCVIDTPLYPIFVFESEDGKPIVRECI